MIDVDIRWQHNHLRCRKSLRYFTDGGAGRRETVGNVDIKDFINILMCTVMYRRLLYQVVSKILYPS